MVESNPEGGNSRDVEEIKRNQGAGTLADLDENLRTENMGGYVHQQVTRDEFDQAESGDRVV